MRLFGRDVLKRYGLSHRMLNLEFDLEHPGARKPSNSRESRCSLLGEHCHAAQFRAGLRATLPWFSQRS